MKPVFSIHKNNSSYLKACVASILEVPIEIIPDLGDGINHPVEQLIRLSKFLRTYNLDIIQYTVDPNDRMDKFYFNRTGYYIGIIPNVSGHWHSVIMNNNQIVHNPEKGAVTLLEAPSKYIIFYNLNPSMSRYCITPDE